MVLAGRHLPQRHGLAKLHAALARQAQHLQLEHLGRRAAAGFDVVNLEVHHQFLRLGAQVAQGEFDAHRAANPGPGRANAGLADRHLGRFAKTQYLQSPRIALLHGPAQRVFHNPCALEWRAFQPAFGHIVQHLGVVFADVVQAVGDRATHVKRRVVFEQFQQRQHGLWVGLERRQPCGPGQARAGAFGHQPAHVFARVPRPLPQARQRGLLVVNQIRAN